MWLAPGIGLGHGDELAIFLPLVVWAGTVPCLNALLVPRGSAYHSWLLALPLRPALQDPPPVPWLGPRVPGWPPMTLLTAAWCPAVAEVESLDKEGTRGPGKSLHRATTPISGQPAVIRRHYWEACPSSRKQAGQGGHKARLGVDTGSPYTGK